MGTIAKSYAINMSNPTVPSFSGRGPNPVYHSILKVINAPSDLPGCFLMKL